jgi:hypothetical protein
MIEPGFYTQEKLKRRHVNQPVRVLELDVPSTTRIAGIPGGSVVVLSAYNAEHDLNPIVEAIGRRDYRALDLLMQVLQRRWRSMRPLPARSTIPLEEIPALAELSYGNRVLASGVFSIPQTGTMATLMPFIGGKLNPSNFGITAYLTPHGQPLEHVVIVRQPALTPIERAVLDKLPEEFSHESLGDATLAAWPGAVAFVLIVAAGVAAAYYFAREAQRVQQERAQQEQQAQEHAQVQQDQQQAQQDQQQAQQDQQQAQQDQQQAQQDQQQADQGQQDRQQNNGGYLGSIFENNESWAALANVNAAAAAQTLVGLRTTLIESGVIPA